MEKTFTKVPSDFWKTTQAKALREGGVEVHFLALYLLTTPHTNRLGIYYLPREYASIDTGLTAQEVSKALEALVKMKFCYYDEASNYIWVCELAQYRIGTALHPNDKQVKGVHNLYESLPDSLPFLEAFYEHYKDLFYLEASSFTDRSPSEGASITLGSNKNKNENKNDNKNKNKSMSGKPDSACKFLKKKSEIKNTTGRSRVLKSYQEQAEDILAFLNEKAGRSYRPVKEHTRLIIARLKSGVTADQCRQIIAKKTREWKGDEEKDGWLRPETLFRAIKFEQYLGELVLPSDATETEEGVSDD